MAVRNAPTTFLMYHELRVPGQPLAFDDAPYAKYVVAAKDFETHMRRIASEGWIARGVTAWQQQPEDRPQVVVTFDDGAASDLLNAAPVLQELGFGATFYLTASFIGMPGFLTAVQARALAATGLEVGSHSMTHAHLTDLAERELRHEIVDSKRMLEDICEVQMTSFSCPGGHVTTRVVEIAREAGYTSVVTSRVHRNQRDASAFSLGRVAVTAAASPDAVWRIVKWEGMARQQLRGAVLGAARSMLGNSLYYGLRRRLIGAHSAD
jgi:peptidoglycan/xylan/chitin deacetylase (PgdA/CDA1 family)